MPSTLSSNCWNRLVRALPEQAVAEGIEKWIGWPCTKMRTAHLCNFDGDRYGAAHSDVYIRSTYRIASPVELADAILKDSMLWSLDDMPYELWLCRYDFDPQTQDYEDRLREGRLTEEQLETLVREYTSNPTLLLQDLTSRNMTASVNAFTYFFEDELAWRNFVLPRVYPAAQHFQKEN